MMANPKPNAAAIKAAEAMLPKVTILKNGWSVKYPKLPRPSAKAFTRLVQRERGME